MLTARERVRQFVRQRLLALLGPPTEPGPCQFRPYLAGQPAWALPRVPGPVATQDAAGLPVPPPDLWAGYGDSPESYLASGRHHAERMLELLATSGFALAPGERLLDFGCAAGRMLRTFAERAQSAEVWGVDIRAAAIYWCQQQLAPPFHFATITTYPHLPFEDRSFKLIYAGSVFSHIADLADAWLLELRRVLAPGGRLYITIHDKRTVRELARSGVGSWPRGYVTADGERVDLLTSDFGVFAFGRDYNSQVFYDADYLTARWGRLLKVESMTPRAYGYQSALVLTKT